MHALHGNGSTSTFVDQLELSEVPALVAALTDKFGISPKGKRELRHALNGGRSTIDMCLADIKWRADFPNLVKGLEAKFTNVSKWSTRGKTDDDKLNATTRELVAACRRFLKMISGDDVSAMLADVLDSSMLAEAEDSRIATLKQNLKEKFLLFTEEDRQHPGRRWIIKALQGVVPCSEIQGDWGFCPKFWTKMAAEKADAPDLADYGCSSSGWYEVWPENKAQ